MTDQDASAVISHKLSQSDEPEHSNEASEQVLSRKGSVATVRLSDSLVSPRTVESVDIFSPVADSSTSVDTGLQSDHGSKDVDMRRTADQDSPQSPSAAEESPEPGPAQLRSSMASSEHPAPAQTTSPGNRASSECGGVDWDELGRSEEQEARDEGSDDVCHTW